MVNKDQMINLIDETLHDIGLHSQEAVSLVYNTGLVESKYEYLYQKGGNNVASILLYHIITYIIGNFLYAPNIEELNLVMDNCGGKKWHCT